MSAERDALLSLVLRDSSENIAEAQLVRLQCFWPDIAGPLAKHCEPQSLRERRLIVRIEQSVYAQELQLRGREIVQRAATLLGIELRDLRIENGPIDWNAAGRRRIPPSGQPGSAPGPTDTKTEPGMDADREQMLEGLRRLL
ncbi:MAG: DUF721 domain-containing protein [Leptospirales bacterium]|nr:DUF721 domain-containing protein [Leptospirales bacterium]